MAFSLELPEGATLVKDFISIGEEAALEEYRAQNLAWDFSLSRATAHLGSWYNYYKAPKSGRSNKKQAKAPELQGPPLQIANRIERYVDANLVHTPCGALNQCIINRYLPGEGIGAHIDDPKLYGPVIASLSTGCGIQMDLTLGNEKVPVWLPRRSLLILQGPARYLWKHSIAKRKTDPDPRNGERVKRTTRISYTFRHATTQ